MSTCILIRFLFSLTNKIHTHGNLSVSTPIHASYEKSYTRLLQERLFFDSCKSFFVKSLVRTKLESYKSRHFRISILRNRVIMIKRNPLRI